ncbi:Uu.00g095790.m01.CDS01 [Anthostomella pinea]|uniref:Uu.00g095790.m01.CDS01 n=1 Tax=Anthostomella pinea TaxID=933095 RepID=A0AAI8YEV6_9PEZI|nr:Uu.00g095790.m01.CDS01 [Anthostomella pinea]
MEENLDESALRELEDVLHTKLYPGTEIMKDVGTHHFVKSGRGNSNVLVPQPSDDPHDPLNWSPMWKAITLTCATMLSFSLNLGPLALAPMFGVAILVLCFSNFIWDPWLGRGKPSKSQFSLFQHYEGKFLRELWVPWYLYIFPIVELAAFVVSFSASGFLVVNLPQTQAFAAPPYKYSFQTIGLFNLAVLIGAIIGLFTNGPWSDWVAAYLTKKNNGVREPEMRLPAMIPYVLIMILGSVVTAVGYDYHWPWQAIVIIGYGCLGMQVSALPSIASTYAVDSYKPITGSLFVAITVNKNVWGYGVSKFLTPWAEEKADL